LFFVPAQLLEDGGTDEVAIRARYRRMVVTVAAASVALFVVTLPIEGVPLDLWLPFTAGTAATACVTIWALLYVRAFTPYSILAALVLALTVFALDRVIGGHYTEAPLLLSLLVAGTSIVQGWPAAIAIVVAGAILEPRTSPTPLNAPLDISDHLFAGLYLLGVAAIVWSYRRLADRVAVAVRTARAQYKELVEMIPAVVYAADPGPRRIMRYVSPRIQAWLGVDASALLGDEAAWLKHVHPDDRAALVAVERGAGGSDRRASEYRLLSSGADVLWVRDEAALVEGEGADRAWRGILVDVTERRALESRLQQARRLEAVGQLAGGVAHDFNNLLTAIRGYAEFVSAGLDEGSRQHEDMAELMYAVDRAAGLTRQLLAFGRRQVLRPEVLEPGEVVEAMLPFLRRLAGEHIEITVSRDRQVGLVRADMSQLEQLVLNLAVNARDAMPDGGRLEIEISPAVVTAAEAADEGIEAGQYVRITVTDTGVGMDEATADHVFEPFFTTKGPGGGTGLGLATVYAIVHDAGGRIRFTSARGAGTTFSIDLPSVAGEVHLDSTRGAAPAGVGRGHVLVVEDEPAVRELTARMLRNLGYSAATAASGPEALEIIEAGAPVDLLLTDIRMPVMQGPELARRVLAQRPGVKVLLMTGYASDVPSAGAPRLSVLAKPFDSATLAAAVRAAMDAEVPVLRS
jgi:PAS domain S-box-containing protein